MSTFFSRIKKQLSKDFGGRYLGVILEQVIADEPKFAQAIFPNLPQDIVRKLSSREAIVTAEKSFPGENGKHRRADLAICVGSKIIALAEIKYEDHKAPKNYAQLQDYLSFVTGNKGVLFTYLTQHQPPSKDDNLLKNASARNARIRHLYFRDLYKAGNSHDALMSVRWLCEFLAEEHVVYKEEFEKSARTALKLLMAKGLYVKHRHGLGKLNTLANADYAGEVFSGLLGNVEALADWFYGRFGDHFGNRFIPDFGFSPELDLKRVARAMTKLTKEQTSIWVPRDAGLGGNFWVLVSGGMKTSSGKKRIGELYFGYYFNLDLKTKKITGDIGAEFYPVKSQLKELEEDFPFTLRNSLKLSERAAQQCVLKAVSSVLEQALADKTLGQSARKSFKKLHAEMKDVSEE